VSTLLPSSCRGLVDADLRRRNTFGVAARAPLLIEVDDARQLGAAIADSGVESHDPLLVLGSGSNLLFAASPVGTVLSLCGQQVSISRESGDAVIVRADAGVEWHGFVMQTLAQGLAGLENLALIPGTVGAAPIQNIGAYGVEVRERIHAVEVFDRVSGQLQRMHHGDCAFAYRDSIFKHHPDRWIVTAVEFNLARASTPVLDYAGLRDELLAMGVVDASPRHVADAVIRIRRCKLPDPAVIGNAGSFFKNPIVPQPVADALSALHPGLPVFPAANGDSRKLSAAWMIDACGWKGYRDPDGDTGVSPSHALVLVNHGHATGMQLLDLARRIAGSVHGRFGVELEPEPRIIGADFVARA